MTIQHTAIDGQVCRPRIGRLSMSVDFADCRDDSDYVDETQFTDWLAIEEAASLDLKEVARVALDTMPDVACSAIAAALGLKLHSVIGLSNGRHNKAKRKSGIELSEVTREELIENYRAQLGA